MHILELDRRAGDASGKTTAATDATATGGAPVLRPPAAHLGRDPRRTA
ncbi:hypothetical protein AB0G15_35350 [Streptosporangium sp. NPDC023825]